MRGYLGCPLRGREMGAREILLWEKLEYWGQPWVRGRAWEAGDHPGVQPEPGVQGAPQGAGKSLRWRGAPQGTGLPVPAAWESQGPLHLIGSWHPSPSQVLPRPLRMPESPPAQLAGPSFTINATATPGLSFAGAHPELAAPCPKLVGPCHPPRASSLTRGMAAWAWGELPCPALPSCASSFSPP